MLHPSREKAFKRLSKPNTLIEYQGGGYEGCFWEYNFAFVDAKGEYKSIYASGSDGCKTVEEMAAYIKRRPALPNFYDVNNKNAMRRFVDECSVDFLLMVARWFSSNNISVELSPKCSCCKSRFDAEDGIGVDPRGAGGLVVVNHAIICPDCYSAYSCSDCGEYCGKGEKWHGSNGEQVCECCWSYHKKQQA